ncbi:Acylphosphate phosphohydrolase [Chitinispirillum alkaliphilum]|nr:Acylphosphate phosphohydrolase [Chitinispirillum alkaliphilum]
MKRFRIAVKGRVQGVGYRFFVVEAAQTLGLSGWARNHHDGSVRLEVQGDEAKLDKFCEMLREGPPLARVTNLDIEQITPSESQTDFHIKY